MSKIAPVVALLSLVPGLAGAAGTTWVHATDTTCGGNSPCYPTLALGIDNVDNGGSVIVLASAVDKIIDTYDKKHITVRGVNDSIQLTGNINLAADEPAVGWTFQDLNFSLGIVIRSISDSITIDNVGAAAIKLGDFDQDINATITIRDVTMQQDVGALISIIAVDGADIGGTISISDCVGIYAININADVLPAEPAVISADITIQRNEVLVGGGINVRGIGVAGPGSITGTIEFSENTMSQLDGKFGVTLYGDVTGAITGPVTFDGNTGSWLAVLTTSTPSGAIGELTFTDNVAEAIEVVSQGALSGPVRVSGNQVVDLGGGTGLDNPLLLLDGKPLSADFVVEDNTAPEADIVARSSSGALTGSARIQNNSAGLITLDSRDGPLTQQFTVSGNTLPTAAEPLSTLTIRTMNGGNSDGGTLSDNEADRITVNFAGSLTSDLNAASNVVCGEATFIASGGPSTGTLVATGNDFQSTSYYDGMHATVRFNRVADRMTVVAGPTVDGRYNWWLCNAGANQPGCSTASTGVFQFAPHLILGSDLSCVAPDLTVSFDVLEASDSAEPPGNITPGTVTVSSTVGVITGSPSTLNGGAGAAGITLPQGAGVATVSVQLDNQVVDVMWPCASAVFADGFESGNTSAWSQLAAKICGCLDDTTPMGFASCLAVSTTSPFSRDLLATRCTCLDAE